MADRKPVIGLAGGIGSGKSQVARILRELGAGIVDADEINRQELDVQEVKNALRSWWGDGIFGGDGRVDRARLADIVFRDPAEKSRLEGLMHPRIGQQRDALIRRFQADPLIRIIILDAPLLYEVGLNASCDAVIFVDAEESVRAARAKTARGWGEEEWARRENSQMPLDLKRSRADYVCSNSSDMAALRHQVEALFTKIVSGTDAVG